MQPVSSGIWTRVAVYISYDDNHYTTGTSHTHQVNENYFNQFFNTHEINEKYSTTLLKHMTLRKIISTSSSIHVPVIGIMVRVFVNCPETWVQSLVELYQRLKKMVFDTTLLNTPRYKVKIKGKVEQSRERSSALPYSLV